MTRVLREIQQWGLESVPEISICIPTFQTPNPRLDRLINSLFRYTPVTYETVVVDCEGESRGYTVPQNEAVSAARAPVIVAANDDVVVSDGWLVPMMAALHEGASCVTPDMTHKDGPQIFAPYFMMWRREAWDEIGGLDAQFFWWCSDIDLARRLADRGEIPVRVKLPTPIEHEPGGTTREHPAQNEVLNEVTWVDLCKYKNKWGVTAEVEKGRLAQLTLGNITWPPG